MDSVVTINEGVENLTMLFYECTNYNKPVTFPNTAKDLHSTFEKCYAYNQPTIIPQGVVSMYGTFNNCSNFNQDMIIPNSVNNMQYTFRSCNAFGSTVTIKPGGTAMNVYGMFLQCNNSLKKTIICAPEDTAKFTVNDRNSVIAGSIAWTALGDGNGYYNSTYNIYIYNNYSA